MRVRPRKLPVPRTARSYIPANRKMTLTRKKSRQPVTPQRKHYVLEVTDEEETAVVECSVLGYLGMVYDSAEDQMQLVTLADTIAAYAKAFESCLAYRQEIER